MTDTFDKIIKVLATAVADRAMAKINDELTMRFVARESLEKELEKRDVLTRPQIEEMIAEAMPSDYVPEDAMDLALEDYVTIEDVRIEIKDNDEGFQTEDDVNGAIVAAINGSYDGDLFRDAVKAAMIMLLASPPVATVIEESATARSPIRRR